MSLARVLVTTFPSPLLQRVGDAITQGVVAAGGTAMHLAYEEIRRSSDSFTTVSGVILCAQTQNEFDSLIDSLSLHADLRIPLLSLCCVHTGNGSQVIEYARMRLRERGATVNSSLLLETRGMLRMLGRGTLSESDFARASALGERMARMLAGNRPQASSEKHHIPGYRK